MVVGTPVELQLTIRVGVGEGEREERDNWAQLVTLVDVERKCWIVWKERMNKVHANSYAPRSRVCVRCVQSSCELQKRRPVPVPVQVRQRMQMRMRMRRGQASQARQRTWGWAAGRQTGRQADRQRDRQTDRPYLLYSPKGAEMQIQTHTRAELHWQHLAGGRAVRIGKKRGNGKGLLFSFQSRMSLSCSPHLATASLEPVTRERWSVPEQSSSSSSFIGA